MTVIWPNIVQKFIYHLLFLYDCVMYIFAYKRCVVVYFFYSHIYVNNCGRPFFFNDKI